MLQLRFPPGTLAALMQQALADLERGSHQPEEAAGSKGRLRNMSMLFHGLSLAFDMFPEECHAALELPATYDVAQEFASRLEAPQDYQQWSEMLTACCVMGFNPPVDSQGVSLLEALLKQMPAMR